MSTTTYPEVWQSSNTFNPDRIRAAAIYCSDGRYGDAFDEFLHAGLGLPRYDRLAVPGGAACLAGHLASHRDEAAMLDQLDFLIRAHQLERVVLIAHHNCAYYRERLHVPAERITEAQLADLDSAASRISTLFPHLQVESHLAEIHNSRIRFRATSSEA